MTELIVMEVNKKNKEVSDVTVPGTEEKVRRLNNKCRAVYDMLTSPGADIIELSSDGAWGVAELFDECTDTMGELLSLANIPRDEVEDLLNVSGAIGRIETNKEIARLRKFLIDKLTDLDRLDEQVSRLETVG